MMDFARENERSELTGELIGDTLDDALADDGDAEAEDKIVSQVSRFENRLRAMGRPAKAWTNNPRLVALLQTLYEVTLLFSVTMLLIV